MRAVLNTFLSLGLIVTSIVAQTAALNVEGNWLATLEISGVKFRLALRIQKSANGYTAKLDSLDQGVTDLPIDSIVLDGSKLTFSAARLGLSYEGALNAAGDEILGTFKQGPAVMPMAFK